MEKEKIVQALQVFSDLKGHIVYDRNLKEICYSAAFVRAAETLRKCGEEKLNELNG